MDEIYDPDMNKYLPEHVAEDFEEYGDTFSYKAEAFMETPIDVSLRAVVSRVLED